MKTVWAAIIGAGVLLAAAGIAMAITVGLGWALSHPIGGTVLLAGLLWLGIAAIVRVGMS